MQRETALAWSWLGVLTHKRYKQLIEAFGDLDNALTALDEKLLISLGCREDTIHKTLNRFDEYNPDFYEAELQKRAITLLSIEDNQYPEQLHNIPDPPIFLQYRGDISIVAQPCVALVGAREMTNYGKRVTEAVTQSVVQAQAVTVSGLARGVDYTVAKETLIAGGKTIAVLGHGMAYISPKEHVRIADEIVEAGGLILSEFPFDFTGDKYTFPARNRIIAALSIGTVVLQAGKGSGALITAELALDYGRDVLAVAGELFDDSFAGCHHFIASGQAKLVLSTQDVINELGLVAPQSSVKSAYKPRNDAEESILQVLTSMPQSTTDIQQQSGLDIGAINAALTMMELIGAVKNVGGGNWIKN